ncbi:MAG: gephyrin-like molybdotransferase Glp [Myxococcales bacterium]
MKPLPVALDLVRSRCRPLGSEEVAVAKAAGRILSHPVSAARDLPGTDISMMDGYALRATDSGETLRVVYEVAAGDPPPARELGGREAARIFTGAPVPPGADCVVMQEQAERRGDELRVPRAAAGQHIRRRGEEVHAGDVVLPSGTTLHAAELSLAAASGSAQVRVYRLPRVAILVTGNELVPVGSDPAPGKLIETNSIAIAQYVREAGAEPVFLGIAKDSTDEIARLLGSAQADVLVTTGGASVGDHDHAQAAFEKLAGELVFHTVAIRPGKPVLFGTAGDRLVFGLPGNPAAAMLGFELFVRPALRIMAGDPKPERVRARAILRGGALSGIPGLTFFPRGLASVEDGHIAFTPRGQQSSMQIGSWSAVNALAQLPPGEGKLEPGSQLDVLLLGPLA